MPENISNEAIAKPEKEMANALPPQDLLNSANIPEDKKPDLIRDNGPRIVGAMKFIPDILLLKSGLRDTGKAPFRAAGAVGFMASRVLLLGYGSKDRAKDANLPESPYKDDPSFTGKVKYNLHKIMHPSHYPVEAGAGVAALAGLSVALSGVAQMRNKATLKEGALELGIGGFTALAEGNVLFSKEKEKPVDDVEKPKAHGIKGMLQKLKDQPVLLSGITQAIASGSQIILGLMTLARSKKNPTEGKGVSWHYLAAASVYTAADLVYAFFVRKNEFNNEVGKPNTAKPQPESDKVLASEPVNNDDIARKLNWQESVQQSSAKDSSLALG